jgi:hypothetical protein
MRVHVHVHTRTIVVRWQGGVCCEFSYIGRGALLSAWWMSFGPVLLLAWMCDIHSLMLCDVQLNNVTMRSPRKPSRSTQCKLAVQQPPQPP